jgi:hypothetical protein
MSLVLLPVVFNYLLLIFVLLFQFKNELISYNEKKVLFDFFLLVCSVWIYVKIHFIGHKKKSVNKTSYTVATKYKKLEAPYIMNVSYERPEGSFEIQDSKFEIWYLKF